MLGPGAFEWSDLRFFLAVSREGSLSAAARRLRVDATTVSRRITALEAALDVKLFARRRSGWTLTPAGQRILPAAEHAESAAATVDRVARGDEPRGRVRISTIEVLSTHLIAPLLPALHKRLPHIRLDLLCGNEILDIRRGEADIGLRLSQPTEPDLVGRRLSQATQRPYAARSWLAARGLEPESVTDLEGMEVLTLLSERERRWSDGLGKVNVVLRTTSTSTLYQATLSGAGVGLLPDVIASTDRRLAALPALDVCVERPLWMVLHRDMAEVPRVRAVADFFISRFGV